MIAIETLKFLIIKKPEFVAILLLLSVMCAFLILSVAFNTNFLLKVKSTILNTNARSARKQRNTEEKEPEFLNRFFPKPASLLEKSILIGLLPPILIIIPLIVYTRIGSIGFPDHNSSGPQIFQQDFSGKPSQETAQLFFEEYKNISKMQTGKKEITDYEATFSSLLKDLKDDPNDIETLRSLVYHNLQFSNFPEAASAQEKIILIQKNRNLVEDYSRLLEILVTGARGYISPKSKKVIDLILKFDGQNKMASLFQGHYYAQSGQISLANQIWDKLVKIYKHDQILLETIQEAKTNYSIN